MKKFCFIFFVSLFFSSSCVFASGEDFFDPRKISTGDSCQRPGYGASSFQTYLYGEDGKEEPLFYIENSLVDYMDNLLTKARHEKVYLMRSINRKIFGHHFQLTESLFVSSLHWDTDIAALRASQRQQEERRQEKERGVLLARNFKTLDWHKLRVKTVLFVPKLFIRFGEKESSFPLTEEFSLHIKFLLAEAKEKGKKVSFKLSVITSKKVQKETDDFHAAFWVSTENASEREVLPLAKVVKEGS